MSVKQYLAIANPHASGFRTSVTERAVTTALHAAGGRVSWQTIESLTTLSSTQLAGFDGILVIGGDGTVRSVAEHLLRHHITVPLGIIPAGSANVLATSLRVPTRPNAIGYVTRGNTITIDYARTDSGAIVLVAAAFGFLSNRVIATKKHFKRLFGGAGYLLSILGSPRLPRHAFSFTVDGEEYRVTGHTLFIANAVSIFGIHPRRRHDLTDGIYELVVTTNRSILSLPQLMYNFYFHDQPSKDFFIAHGKRFTIESSDNPHLLLDGEATPYTGTIAMDVVPRGLTIFMP